MARTGRAKAAWRSKRKRYCVSAGAPGYGMKIQRCFKSKANAQKACRVFYRPRGNNCKVIGTAKGGKKRCWCCPKKKK